MGKFHEMRSKDKSKRREQVSLDCLTMWQPWASGVAKGIKTIETRPPSFRYQPTGLLGIHAGKKWDDFFNPGHFQAPLPLKCFDLELLREAFKVRGAIIAVVPWAKTKIYQNIVQWDLDFDKHRCPHNFFELGKRGLILGPPKLIKPIYTRGYQGTWGWDGVIEYLESKSTIE